MNVRAEKTPETEGIKKALDLVDFTDTFSTTNHIDSLEVITQLIFATTPLWVSYLMKLRNSIVRAFGLKTKIPDDYNTNIAVGGYFGFFKIFSLGQDEIIIGANDKHLNFRASIYNSKEPEFNIKVSTLVQYNNYFGKVYMYLIKPFHFLVVRSMVKQAYKANF